MYRGDIRRGQTLDFGFTTAAAGTGAPTQLAGTPVLSCYKGNSTTETTTGVTLTVDFDSRTGFNHCRVVTTDSFYEPGYDYRIVITTGTVDGTSAVGYVVGAFSIENRFQGEASQGTAQGGAAQTITLASTESSTDDVLIGDGILIVSGTGAQQWRGITDYVGSTRVATVDRAWAVQPDNTSVYRRFPGSQPSTVAEIQSGLALEASVQAVPAEVLAAEVEGVPVSDLLQVAGGVNFAISGTTLTVKDLAGATLFTRTLTLAERDAINAAAVP